MKGLQAPARFDFGGHGWGSACLQVGWKVLSARSRPLQEAAAEVDNAVGRQGITRVDLLSPALPRGCMPQLGCKASECCLVLVN